MPCEPGLKRGQLQAMLLRQGHRYTGKTSWTTAHERFLGQFSFAHPAQDIAYAEYRSAVQGPTSEPSESPLLCVNSLQRGASRRSSPAR